MGFGLVAEEVIPRGAFIIEYVGELLTKKEAAVRHKLGFKDSFILSAEESYQTSDTVLTIVDARHMGNAARFANHSCNPNAKLVPVHIENEFPRIALFALQDISPNEEIFYSYGSPDSGLSETPCLCKSSNCPGFMPKDET